MLERVSAFILLLLADNPDQFQEHHVTTGNITTSLYLNFLNVVEMFLSKFSSSNSENETVDSLQIRLNIELY